MGIVNPPIQGTLTVQLQPNNAHRSKKIGNTMNTFSTRFGTLCVTALLSVGAAFAQAPATASTASTAPAATAAAKSADAKPATTKAKSNKQFTPKSAKSKACSAKADEQKLRGKARQKFREECKKAA